MGYYKKTVEQNYNKQNTESAKPVTAQQKKSRKITIDPIGFISITTAAVAAIIGFIGIKSSIKEDKRLYDIYYEDYCQKKLSECHEPEMYQISAPMPSGKTYYDVAEHFKKSEEDRVHRMSLALDERTGQQIIKITYAKGR